MTRELFGNINGKPIYKYTLNNDKLTVKIMTRGATITELTVGGVDIIGGFDSLSSYEADSSHQGAIIGRIANRVANASFVMDGKTYTLPKNNGENCLHGGDGFDHKIWDVTEASDTDIVLEYYSKDGEEGFPSGLKVKVRYSLSDNDLMIEYEAIPDGKTPISLTNHAYFNLDGFGGTICDHFATIYADRYTEVNDALIPNGNHPCVEATPFDFRTPHKIGERIGGDFIGYDHNFVLCPKENERFGEKELGIIATVEGKRALMNVFTDQPGVQFYIGNFLADAPTMKGGIKPIMHGAFCLETQTEPNSVNHGVGFYDKGEIYTHTTVYRIEPKA